MIFNFFLIPLFVCLPAVWSYNGTNTNFENPEDNVVEVVDTRQKLYAKMYKYFLKTKYYGNFTFQDAIHHIDHVEDWTAPEELEKDFPYYHSGYDFEDRPVWVMEWGRYNLRKHTERGPAAAENVTLYMYQAIHRVFNSMIAKDTAEREIRGLVLIGDAAGFDIIQSAHGATVAWVLSILKENSDFVSLILGHAMIINMSYITTALFDLVRPILGGVFERIELYGSNKAKWMGVLRKKLPLEAIPTWYGGSKDYKPVKVYG